METMTVTIELPKTEATFFKEYAKRHHFTISELIDLYIKQLQLSEQLFASSRTDREVEAELEQHAGVIPPDVDYVLHPDIKKLSGIVPGDIDAKKEYYEYLEEKYR